MIDGKRQFNEQYPETGEWLKKERVVASDRVGVYVTEDGAEIETDKLMIHYGKKGTHIMARREEEK